MYWGKRRIIMIGEERTRMCGSNNDEPPATRHLRPCDGHGSGVHCSRLMKYCLYKCAISSTPSVGVATVIRGGSPPGGASAGGSP